MKNSIEELLESAFAARKTFHEENHITAFRLFNGFLEGFPAITIDIYATTALIHNHAAHSQDDITLPASDWLQKKLPWLNCILVKNRHSSPVAKKDHIVLFGETSDQKIFEDGVWYKIAMEINRDASLYLDTRNLRKWARIHLTEKTVLNTFAYTGSLGVAALAGGASRVVQLDRNSNYLELARQSCALNNLTLSKQEFICQDFFPAIGQLKRQQQLFDCVILDPPFFSSTSKGTVDLEQGTTRLINKIRPLVKDEGWLVAINNALYVSGDNYIKSLETLCQDGYLSIEELIPVPIDFTGYPETIQGTAPTNPSPFNHSTKIVVLRVRKKH